MWASRLKDLADKPQETYFSVSFLLIYLLVINLIYWLITI